MLCDKCKEREATFHVTKVVNQKKTEEHLCGHCANEHKQIYYHHGNMFDVFQDDFFKNMFVSEYAERRASTMCPSCKMTLQEFNHSGKLGCPSCYQVFSTQLKPLVQRLHGSLQYQGGFPKHAISGLKNQEECLRLKKELEIAVQNEDFEGAARIRDKIKALEKGI